MIKIERTQHSETFWKDNGAWDAERHYEYRVKVFGVTMYRKVEDYKLTPRKITKNDHLIGFKNGK
jgi:hypothetical protein